MAIKKGGLGKGLDALFTENFTDGKDAVELKLTDIEPNRSQPRKEFDQQALEELADSIARYGVLQPLLVRPLGMGGYQLVAGERRWRASRMAGLTTVPVVIRELSDAETMEIALIENLQREDLNPVEEAEGYRTLMEQFHLTQDTVAERVGRSRPAVANAIRLLALPQPVLQMVADGSISSGHGRAILAMEDPEQQLKAAEFAKSGATVREIERMAQSAKQPAKKAAKSTRKPIYGEVELALTETLGRRVKVAEGRGKGTLQIEFYNQEDLVELANRLGGVES